MPLQNKWSSFHRGVLADRSISSYSQDTDSDPAASKTQNMPSACLQCWNSLGWEVAPRAWESCYGTTAEALEKIYDFQALFKLLCSKIPRPSVSSSSVGTCPPLYSKSTTFIFFVRSMCSPWKAKRDHRNRPLNKALLIIYSALLHPVHMFQRKCCTNHLSDRQANCKLQWHNLAQWQIYIYIHYKYNQIHVIKLIQITHCKGLAKTKCLESGNLGEASCRRFVKSVASNLETKVAVNFAKTVLPWHALK